MINKPRVPMRVTAIKKVLPFIIKYKKKNGFAPSFREIAFEVKKKSPFTVSLYLAILKKEGYIKLAKQAHRHIEVLKEPSI